MEDGSPSWQGYLSSLPLRERKKVRTKLAVQEHALRLFGERGYTEVTVEDVAAAAEVATRTVFRYFPTKDELVLWDVFDESAFDRGRLAELFGQLEAATPAAALVELFRWGLAELQAADPDGFRTRLGLIVDNPALADAAWGRLRSQTEPLADALAVRFGQPAADPQLRVVVAALVAALFQGAMDWIAKTGPDTGQDGTDAPFDGDEIVAHTVGSVVGALEGMTVSPAGPRDVGVVGPSAATS